jgi:preprotein translocase subunit SecE
MTMNREQRRMMQRQGHLDEQGEAVRTPQRRAAPPTREDRTTPVQFLREVRSEMKKVAWPTRQETIKYSLIVLATLVVLTTFIAGLDWILSDLVLRLFKA